MTIASAVAFSRILSNDEKKQDKERRDYQGKLCRLEVDDNQFLIEIKKETISVRSKKICRKSE